MGVLSLVLVGIGAAMIVAGVVVALLDWRKKQQPAPGELVQESLPDTLGALEKLIKAMESYPFGLKLVVLGIVVVVVGGTLGGISAL